MAEQAEATGQIRVLSSSEKEAYQGTTIDMDGNADSEQRPRYYRVHSDPQGGTFFSARVFDSLGGSWVDIIFGRTWQTRLVRGLALAGGAALLVLFVGFVLPFLLLGAGVALAGAVLWQFLRRWP